MPPTAYGANPNSGVPRNVANGWDGVWPNGVPRERLGVARAAGVAVAVQARLVPLVEALLTLTEALGYEVKAGQTWGYANRPIRGTRAPSNHSRGKAVDINSLANPMGSVFRSDLPPAVVTAWEKCGWYWGGRYANRPDAMHFEYLGRPSDVERDLATARTLLANVRAAKAEPKWRPRVDAKPGIRDLRRGCVGDDVALIQRFLGVEPANGKYGDRTTGAVRLYQKMRGLKVDGVVGEKTWAPILRALKLSNPRAPKP